MAEVVRIAHAFGISRTDAIELLVTRNMSVRKLAHQVPGDRAAESPSGIVGRSLREGVELGAGYVGRFVVMGLHPLEDAR